MNEDSRLFEDLWSKGSRHQVWMSHGDRVTKLPERFEVVAASFNTPYAFIADEKRRYYGVQFHPEVMHTPDGAKLIANFIHNIAGIQGDWTMSAPLLSSQTNKTFVRDEQVELRRSASPIHFPIRS